VCFASEQDFAAYASWLKDYSKKYQEAKVGQVTFL
jgi:hypothetical protein